jgi:hypothetical protein
VPGRKRWGFLTPPAALEGCLRAADFAASWRKRVSVHSDDDDDDEPVYAGPCLRWTREVSNRRKRDAREVPCERFAWCGPLKDVVVEDKGRLESTSSSARLNREPTSGHVNAPLWQCAFHVPIHFKHNAALAPGAASARPSQPRQDPRRRPRPALQIYPPKIRRVEVPGRLQRNPLGLCQRRRL